MTRPQLIIEFSPNTNPLDIPTWVDISTRIINMSCRRGRSNEQGRFEAGTATITLDNDDGAFTPGNTFSPYYGNLKPMRRIRARAVWNNVSYALWSGFIQRWPPTWPGGLEGTITLQCVDGTVFLSQNKINYTWSIESSHWRIHGMLNAVGWPNSDRAIATSGTDVRSGKSLVPAIALTDMAPLNHIQEVTLAEDGAFFFSPAGLATFQGRHWRQAYSRSTTVQATFGQGAGELPYLQITPSLDDAFILNSVRLTRPGGATQFASDATSQAQYGTRSYVTTLQLTNDGEVHDRATWLVAKNKDSDLRFLSLTATGLHDDALWPVLLGLDISDRVAVVLRPPASSSIRRECFIESITHNITATTWETMLSLSPTTLGDGVQASFLVLDHATLGQLDLNMVGY